MNHITYVKFEEIEPKDFLPLLNKETTRAHLIDHDMFDVNNVKEWIQSKIKGDLSQGCRVRVILVDRQLAGWCEIQKEERRYEIAIVIDDRYWE